MEIQIAGSLGHSNARSCTNFTAASPDSRLKILLRIPILQFRQTPYLGVHETGSRPRRLKAQEDENARLKKLLSEQVLDNAI